ncbi:MAG: Uncharacterised protein [SAR116 cluster bacterium]|nr:MAG: Uncharacterised protein [SAR116 cluster bacterium]
MAKKGFANSDGCRLMPAIVIHRVAPLISLPTRIAAIIRPMVTASPKIARMRIGRGSNIEKNSIAPSAGIR